MGRRCRLEPELRLWWLQRRLRPGQVVVPRVSGSDELPRTRPGQQPTVALRWVVSVLLAGVPPLRPVQPTKDKWRMQRLVSEVAALGTSAADRYALPGPTVALVPLLALAPLLAPVTRLLRL